MAFFAKLAFFSKAQNEQSDLEKMGDCPKVLGAKKFFTPQWKGLIQAILEPRPNFENYAPGLPPGRKKDKRHFWFISLVCGGLQP